MSIWDWSVFFHNLVHPAILEGLWTTIWLTLLTLFLAIVLGTAVALVGRIGHVATRWFYQGYVAFFRATPLLVQLVFLYSALPQMGIRLSVVEAAIIGLMLSESPYVAEIVRSSLSAVPVAQWEAARAIGMRPGGIMRAIIFPQALRIAVPPLGNEFVRQLKNTSLVSVISMTELFRATDNLTQTNFRVLEALTVATIYYLGATAVWTLLQNAFERRNSRWFAESARPAARQTGA
ncbi:amino acid ABC transporter permease [Sinirhodobacter populi]|uniref:Amino acid ABC transporter permease n=1 Tax=Paenirhodobacter populi TaxID=2306993 RepID=A0A443K2F9_9RHOB|nr:amino acid ABC transporter permease [Sinirhodobacter populi]RWR26947.1 amino acid ABC transporter permease [Sinirhodobacter populi]